MTLLRTIPLLFPLLLLGCATVVAPTGGPEDKAGPRVIGVLPAPKALSASRELDVRFQFDEWIMESPPAGAALLSPPVRNRLKIEVDGDALRITTKDTLRANTTYTLTLTAAMEDLRRNPMAAPFRLRFSTGSTLDSFSVIGSALRPQGADSKGALAVALWPLDSLPTDSSPDILKTLPLYLGVADSNGQWRIEGMRSGKYRLLAFQDGDRNGRPDPSLELIGISEQDVVVADTGIVGPSVILSDMDTTSLGLEGASQRGPGMIEISFSRNPDRKRSDSIVCSLGSTPSSAQWFEALAGNLIVQFPASIEDTLVEVSCRGAVDSLGRSLDTARARAKVRMEIWKDSVATRVNLVEPTRNSKDVLPHLGATIAFNQPIDTAIWLPRIRMIASDSDTVAHVTKLVDPIRLHIYPSKPLPSGTRIRILALPEDTIDSRGEVLAQWETLQNLKLTRLRGKIPGGDDLTRVELRNLETKTTRSITCQSDGGFLLDSLIAAPHLLRYFRDRDRDGRHNGGRLSPWTPPEPFRQPADTLQLPRATESDLSTLLTDLPILP